MNCEEAQNLALLKSSGEASPEECAALAKHLDVCESCRNGVSGTNRAIETYRARRKTFSLPENLRETIVRESVAGITKSRAPKIIRIFSIASAVAAAVILAVLLNFTDVFTSTNPGSLDDEEITRINNLVNSGIAQINNDSEAMEMALLAAEEIDEMLAFADIASANAGAGEAAANVKSVNDFGNNMLELVDEFDSELSELTSFSAL